MEISRFIIGKPSLKNWTEKRKNNMINVQDVKKDMCMKNYITKIHSIILNFF